MISSLFTDGSNNNLILLIKLAIEKPFIITKMIEQKGFLIRIEFFGCIRLHFFENEITSFDTD